MKHVFIFTFILFFAQNTHAQIVNIPDANFKNALLNYSFVIDTNADGEIQESEAEVLTSLSIISKEIVSLEGIQYFTNIVALDCSRNDITSLGPLSSLTGLQILYCAWNSLSSLNNISTLTQLTSLNCENNDLIELDISSFSNISTLRCNSNQLTTLDATNLNNLIFLDCNRNNIATLTLTGANSIVTLKCNENMLTTLSVNNLTNLTYLTCTLNQITQLDVSTLNSLEELYCTGNSISSLDVSGLENLDRLVCRFNALTSLNVSDATNLRFLDARNNMLSNVDLNGLENLDSARVTNNNLTSLTISGSSIEYLYCENNQLTTLDATNAPNLRILDCSSNNLTSLFIKNGIYQSSVGIFGNPNLEFICVDNTELENVQERVDLYGYNTVVNSYCSFNPGGSNFNIQGSNTLDLDTNGCDASDIPFPNLKFNIDNGIDAYQEIANDSGEYNINMIEGSHTITPILENPDYFSISPTSITVNTSEEASPYLQDFCITANGTIADLEIVIIPLTVARPAFNADYKLIYRNKGNTILSGVIDFTFQDNVMDFVSANPAPDAQSTNLLNWNYNNLLPLEQRQIFFTMNLNNPSDTPPLNGGEILAFSGTINPLPSDETPDDNVFNLNQIVVNSVDPNDKTCLEGETITPELIGEFVHYLVRFENSGTANAINVVVKDIIDTSKFNIESLFITDASHGVETKIENNVVEFIFENINLPFDDANNDGFVAFKIKTLPTLVEGDTFENDAEIFFDYNFPIDTNVALTTILEPLSIIDLESLDIRIYPNPTHDKLFIEGISRIKSIALYDISGRMIQQFLNLGTNNSIEMSIQSLSQGTYFVKVKTESGESVKKIVKQ